MKDMAIVFLFTLAVACVIFGWPIYMAIKQTKQTRREKETCAPYLVLSSYEFAGKEYVVCGNKEIRETKRRQTGK